jgi:phage gpG-like protein
MAPGDVFLEVKWDDAELRAAMARVASLPPQQRYALATAIGGRMVTSTVLRFQDEVSPEGVKWIPSQRVLKHGGKTLQLHGYLVGSITYNAGPDGVEWGSPLRYAAAMQGGASIRVYARSQQLYRLVSADGISARFVRKSKSNFVQRATIGEHQVNIPARPFLGISSDDALEIEDASSAFMLRVLNGGSGAQA